MGKTGPTATAVASETVGVVARAVAVARVAGASAVDTSDTGLRRVTHPRTSSSPNPRAAEVPTRRCRGKGGILHAVEIAPSPTLCGWHLVLRPAIWDR